MPVHAMAAHVPGGRLEPFEYDFDRPLQPGEVEIAVSHCGICHSDVSMIDNAWQISSYPIVPGHEIIGTVAECGPGVRLAPGTRVGVGWNAASCGVCEWCLGGDDNLCGEVEGVIVGRHGGFADRVRVSARFALPIPEGLDSSVAGPLLCGGITVYNPLKQFGVRPSDRVGVVGIGGLGHMAVMFARAWGCEVTAFSTSPDKEAEARQMGAHHFVATRDPESLAALRRSFDMVLVTVNVPLDWPAYINTLRPRGKLVMVGAVLEPMSIPAFQLITGLNSVAGSPTGSAQATADMLQFAARHGIKPIVQHHRLSEVNEALDILRAGKARYRLVLHV